MCLMATVLNSIDLEDMSITASHLQLVDVYRTLYPAAVENTFFQVHMELSPRRGAPYARP